MYLRWKRYKRARTFAGQDADLLTAVLVRSERVEGKVRARHVCYLTSIRESVRGSATWQHHCWTEARRKLDVLEISGDERARIEASLRTIIAEPDILDVEQARAAYYRIQMDTAALLARNRDDSDREYYAARHNLREAEERIAAICAERGISLE